MKKEEKQKPREKGKGTSNSMQRSTEKQRDKKALINEQCIKLEENKRRKKNRDLFMKIRNIKGIFQPKMGTIKDSNVEA